MLKLTKKTKITAIIILIIIVPICIYNNLFLINKVKNQPKNNVSEKFFLAASDYLKEQLQLQGEFTDQTKIVATKAMYFYDETASNKSTLQKVEVILKVGENSAEMFFGLNEYVVTFNLDKYENIVMVGYEKQN